MELSAIFTVSTWLSRGIRGTLEVISTRSMLAKPRGVSFCVDTAPPLVGCEIIHWEAVSLRIGYDGLLVNQQ